MGRPLKLGLQGQHKSKAAEITIRALRVLLLVSLLWCVVPVAIGALFRACTYPKRRDFTFICPDKRENLDLTSLNIRTFNTALLPEFAVAFNGLRPGRKRVKMIADEILNKNDDVVCLQECFHTGHSDYLVKKLKKRFPYIITQVGPRRNGINSGLFLASRVPIVAADYRKFQNLFGECRYSNKGYLAVTLDLGKGKKVNLMTTHLQAKMDRSERYPQASIDLRAEQVEELSKFAQSYQEKNHSLGFILTGDLNIHTPGYSDHQKLWQYANLFEHTRESTVWVKKDLWDLSRVDKWRRQFGRKLDYIAAFKGMDSNLHCIEQAVDPMAGSSDHLAFTRKIELIA
ncbi:MAG: endonuclease/exonuclease/phosphatase family protein [Simkaniaceae bacterium]|nr:endonuclease/exonuclease/phosphatase family protein [Simkaniaceae bacterium]